MIFSLHNIVSCRLTVSGLRHKKLPMPSRDIFKLNSLSEKPSLECFFDSASKKAATFYLAEPFPNNCICLCL
jgi:hypothetical protein